MTDHSAAIVLAGGFGTRIRHMLPDLPKPLAPVAGRPFLYWVIHWLHGEGWGRIVLSTGYLAEKIEAFAETFHHPGISLSCVRETSPLGTAGAALNALRAVPEEVTDVLVCNGDSLVLASTTALRDALAIPTDVAAILGVYVDDASRYGTVETDAHSQLVRFAEKRPGKGIVNAGVYLFRRRSFASFPKKIPLSFEHDVFPALLSQGAVIRVRSTSAAFIDIGTSDSLRLAPEFIARNNVALRDKLQWLPK